MGKNTTNDMTQGNCMRLLVQFFLPILAGNLFQQLYSLADSMVGGKRNWRYSTCGGWKHQFRT
ncbi:MAG: hypothetical protein U0K73_01980, partial [Lachnospiraceae bacterium]|nr:hypothetical protein [Lachnospiraceae bacterium]